MAKMTAQHMSLSQAIALATKQADADEENLPKIEQSIRSAVAASEADGLMRGLKARDYSHAELFDDVLGAANRSYVANDWGQLANRETAEQLGCIGTISAKSLSGQLRTNGASISTNSISESAGEATHAEAQTQLNTSSSGPSMDETVKFLQSKIQLGSTLIGRGTWSGGRHEQMQARWTWTEFAIKNCIYDPSYMLETFVVNPRDGSLALDEHSGSPSQVDLAKLSPDSVKVFNEADEIVTEARRDGASVGLTLEPVIYETGLKIPTKHLHRKKGTPPVTTFEQFSAEFKTHPDYYDVSPGYQDVAFFHGDDRELAVRVAKAVRHTIELCGGKPDAF